jgi:hypothetical protein
MASYFGIDAFVSRTLASRNHSERRLLTGFIKDALNTW